MVRVKGQIDAPLVNIEAMQQEYWERREVKLGSLSKLHKPKGWRSWFYKEQAPKLILQRLSTDDWKSINNEFYGLRNELAKDMPMIKQLTAKALEQKEITSKERAFLDAAEKKTRPMMYAMLSKMIIEPVMSYEEVVLMFEFLDDYDEATLLAFANDMTSEKASVMNAVMRERTHELSELTDELRMAM